MTPDQEYAHASRSLEPDAYGNRSVCFWTSTAAVEQLRASGNLPAGVNVKQTENGRALLVGVVRKDQPTAASTPHAKETDMDQEKKQAAATLQKLRESASDEDKRKIDAALKLLDDGKKNDDGDEDRQDVKGLDRATIEAIDRAMGIDGGQNNGIKRTPTTLVLGNMTREEARAHLAKLEREGR